MRLVWDHEVAGSIPATPTTNMKKYLEFLHSRQVIEPGWHKLTNHPDLKSLLDRIKVHYYKPETKRLEYWSYTPDSPWLRELSNDQGVPFDTVIDWFFDPEFQKLTQGCKYDYCDYSHPEMQDIWAGLKEYFARQYNLDPAATKIILHVQKPGNWFPLHLDYVKTPKFWEREADKSAGSDRSTHTRYLVFFDDWSSGQSVEMNEEFLKWKGCDILEYSLPNSPHATANLGFEDRFLLTVTGKFKV